MTINVDLRLKILLLFDLRKAHTPVCSVSALTLTAVAPPANRLPINQCRLPLKVWNGPTFGLTSGIKRGLANDFMLNFDHRSVVSSVLVDQQTAAFCTSPV